MKRKVLIINNAPKPLPPVEGGAVETLIQLLIEDCPDDIDLTVACIKSDKAMEASAKYPKVEFKYLDFHNKLYLFQLYCYYIFNHYLQTDIGNALCNLLCRNLNLNDYDIIISENGVRLGKSLKKVFKGKIILHLHNDWLNVHTKFAKLYKQSYDEIWTISNFLKRRVEQIPGTTNVRVFYNSVDQSVFLPQSDENRHQVRTKYKIGLEDIVLAICSRIVEEKGVLETIEVFKRLQQAMPDKKLKLLVIGAVSEKNKYQKSCIDSANKDVVFTGYVNHDELPTVMGCADIGIAPTTHKKKYYKSGNYRGFFESFCLTVVEFLSLGIPVVCTNSGGMPEILEHDFPSHIVSAEEDEFNDSLFNALKDVIENKNSIIKDRLISVAKKFSKQSYITRFQQYIEEL